MDLPHTFGRVARYLLRRGRDPQVVFRRSTSGSGHWICTITCGTSSGSVVGSAASSSLAESFIRALSEVGECILGREYSYPTRSGLAGGLIRSKAIYRGKAELIERDSFLFHYRSGVPFNFRTNYHDRKNNKKLYIYELSSRVPGFCVVLATRRNQIAQGRRYLHFGSGAAGDFRAASEKAINEYFSLQTVFETDRERLEALLNGAVPIDDRYRHILACFDHRNIEKFDALCSIEARGQPVVETNLSRNADWTVENLDSPVRFFQYVKVSNSNLVKISFGEPELTFDSRESPLFHPFW